MRWVIILWWCRSCYLKQLCHPCNTDQGQVWSGKQSSFSLTFKPLAVFTMIVNLPPVFTVCTVHPLCATNSQMTPEAVQAHLGVLLSSVCAYVVSRTSLKTMGCGQLPSANQPCLSCSWFSSLFTWYLVPIAQSQKQALKIQDHFWEGPSTTEMIAIKHVTNERRVTSVWSWASTVLKFDLEQGDQSTSL